MRILFLVATFLITSLAQAQEGEFTGHFAGRTIDNCTIDLEISKQDLNNSILWKMEDRLNCPDPRENHTTVRTFEVSAEGKLLSHKVGNIVLFPKPLSCYIVTIDKDSLRFTRGLAGREDDCSPTDPNGRYYGHYGVSTQLAVAPEYLHYYPKDGYAQYEGRLIYGMRKVN